MPQRRPPGAKKRIAKHRQPEPQEPPAVPRIVISERNALERTLRSMETLIACYPQAAAVIIRLLIDEGRAFATQPDGRRMMRELSESAWVERGRILWEACGLDAPVADPNPTAPILPSTWMQSVREDLGQADIEKTLSKLMFAQEPRPR
jgi:hypothetical protein